MKLTLNHVAMIGYSCLFLFGAYKLGDTYKRPVDFVANLLLLVGLGALIRYHYVNEMTGKDEINNTEQKNTRLLAHSCIITFFLLTLTAMSAARFQPYDWFGLSGHIVLFITVLKAMSQVVGLGLLALYFAFASYQKVGKGGMEILQLIGRLLMLLFFIAAFAMGLLQKK